MNKEKFGCYTPGSLIPIISEELILSADYDYLLILPWYFKNSLKTKNILKKLIFPLPDLEILDK